MAVVFVWVMTLLIAALGAVAGLRALTDWLAGSGSETTAVDAVASEDVVVPRPPTTQADFSQLAVLAPVNSTTTTSLALGPFPSTTIFIPEIRSPTPPDPDAPSPTSSGGGLPAPAPQPPPPPTTVAPPPTTVAPIDVLTYELTGGWVQVVASPTSVVLGSSGPAEGFVSEAHRAGPVEVSVRFASPNHTSLLSVVLVRGELVVSVSEIPAG